MNSPLRWLVRRTVIRRAVKRWPATLLSAAAIALAGATFVSVLSASSASVAAFSDSIGGAETIELRSRGGVFSPREAHEWLRKNYRSFDLVPFLEAQASYDAEEIPLLGTDLGATGETSRDVLFLSNTVTEIQPDGAPITITIKGRAYTFSRASRLSGDGPETRVRALFLDIAEMQRRLGATDEVSWISLSARHEGASVAGELPPGFYLVTPGERATQARTMLAAFELNISIMVLMTLLVSAMLILNTVQLSVLAAQSELGTLRALGVSSGQVAALVLAEGAILGFLGSAAGLLLGRGLAERIAALFLDTAGALYFGGSNTRYLQLFDSPWPIVLGVLVGCSVSLVGSAIPAWQASKIPPALSAKSAPVAAPGRRMFGLGIGIAAILGTVVAAQCALSLRLQWLAQLSALGVIIAVAAASPIFLVAVIRVFKRCFSRASSPEVIVGQAIAGSSPRAGGLVCIVAGLSLSLLLGLGVMTGSFRKTLESWTDFTLQADLFIRAPDRGVVSSQPSLPGELVERVSRIPGVEFVSRYEKSDEDVLGRPVTVAGTDLGYLLQRGVYRLTSGECATGPLSAGKTAILSEVASRKLTRNVGEKIDIFGTEFEVCGVFSDFASQSGSILLDRKVYETLSGAAPIYSVGVYLGADGDRDSILQQAESIFREDAIVIDNAGLKRAILETFDRTFAITEIIRILLFLMALGGVFVSMIQLLWSLSGEIREFRVIGGSSGQVYRAIFLAAAEIGTAASVVGLAGGLALACVLIFVINPVSFGWSLEFRPGARDFMIPLGAVFGGIIAVSLLSGRYLKSSWNSLGLKPVND